MGQRPPARRCRCAARKKRTTTATSPSRTCRRSTSIARMDRRIAPGPAGAAGGAQAPLRRRQYALAERRRAADASRAALARLLRGAAGASGQPEGASNWIMGELARKLKETAIDDRGLPPHARGARGLIRLVDAGHDQRPDRERGLREDVRGRAAPPTRSSRRKDSARMTTTAALEKPGARRGRGERGGRRAISRRQDGRRSASWSAR